MIKITEKYYAKKSGAGYELIELVEKYEKTTIKDGIKETTKLTEPLIIEKFVCYPSTLESCINSVLNHKILKLADSTNICNLKEIRETIDNFKTEIKNSLTISCS